MTRISPSSGEPLDATPRLSMSPQRRARILARFNGCCAYPECRVETGLELDHQIALFLGGKDDDTNIIPLCRDHHAAKTRLDHKLMAKVRRLRVKQLPKDQQPPTQKIRSRGFQRRWENV